MNGNDNNKPLFRVIEFLLYADDLCENFVLNYAHYIWQK